MQPTNDGSCKDDPSIANDSHLYRRIHPDQFVPDENAGTVRPSSAAFTNSEDGSPMSVALGDTLSDLGRAPATVLDHYRRHALARLTAAVARESRQTVCRLPVDDEPAHGGVGGTKSKGVRRQLAQSSVWEVPPDPTR